VSSLFWPLAGVAVLANAWLAVMGEPHGSVDVRRGWTFTSAPYTLSRPGRPGKARLVATGIPLTPPARRVDATGIPANAFPFAAQSYLG